ncbi:hypothetical protein PVOR_03020 [Paenibacillus vortex V453]|uniref:Uncharacterized protein n=1 Tax=Paenibacillus vortex V453 TaxID=715225 RepID=A0A2R9T112_9BACL|nr:DUF3891 family protein [Paenibacillus vortex]EFU43307.1 hypothetical protein PVOR_03020 [Paenibacillus vortex V453]
MIIRETEDAFVMTTQDDHGRFSGEIARGFRRELFMDESVLEEVLLAIAEHDRAWLLMDDMPIWNDESRTPFTFMDYPPLPKLLMYSKGVEETIAMSPYAGYLCSLHYASFMKNTTEAPFADFYRAEQARQQELRNQFSFPDDDTVTRQFGLLQLCDDLSLYVNMNPPGASKDQEHPWFREGFNMSIDGQRVVATWASEHEIQISPFLFERKWSASIKWKHVLKSSIEEQGIAKAFHDALWTEQTVTFVP